jgi:nicotinate-nucleotide adenylyltransferase
MTFGILGGTFDPIHIGHLDVALAARAALRIDRIVLVPARQPPHRAAVASAAHRFAMAALAARTHDCLILSDEEMMDAASSYTDATLARWTSRGHTAADMCFITGADAFAGIRSWHNYPGVLDWCHFAVVARPGWPVDRLKGELPELAARMQTAATPLSARPGIVLIDAATSPASSSEVRRRIQSGEPFSDLVPADVARYIRQQGLYGIDSKGLE